MNNLGWVWTGLSVLCVCWWYLMFKLGHPSALWLFCDMLRLC